jgi:hypothetical protein
MVTKRRRAKDAPAEMKEIVLKSPAGQQTSTSLSFGNNRPDTLIMRPRAIVVRFEPSISHHLMASMCAPRGDNISAFSFNPNLNTSTETGRASVSGIGSITGTGTGAGAVGGVLSATDIINATLRTAEASVSNADKQSAFQVYPQKLPIAPGGQSKITVTFAPPAGCCGVFSGVLKIKAGAKVQYHKNPLAHTNLQALMKHFFNRFI